MSSSAASDAVTIPTWKTSVEEEIEKNSGLKTEDIRELQQWISTQPQLPSNISENQVILFLHAASYRMKDAKKLVENYYSMRTRYTQFFSNRDPLHQHIQQSLDISACIVHGKDRDGRNIIWTKLLNTDYSLYYPTVTTKIMFMVEDIDQVESGTVPGYTMVMDGKDFSISHALRCSFGNAQKIISYVQTGSTIIIEKVFILNMTPAAEKVMSILKPLIRSELFKKITICHASKAHKEMFEVIPIDVVPRDYGGNAPPIQELNDIWKEKLVTYKDWFAEEEKFRMNKKGQSSAASTPTEEDNLEMEGSFKSLAID